MNMLLNHGDVIRSGDEWLSHNAYRTAVRWLPALAWMVGKSYTNEFPWCAIAMRRPE